MDFYLREGKKGPMCQRLSINWLAIVFSFGVTNKYSLIPSPSAVEWKYVMWIIEKKKILVLLFVLLLFYVLGFFFFFQCYFSAFSSLSSSLSLLIYFSIYLYSCTYLLWSRFTKGNEEKERRQKEKRKKGIQSIMISSFIFIYMYIDEILFSSFCVFCLFLTNLITFPLMIFSLLSYTKEVNNFHRGAFNISSENL